MARILVTEEIADGGLDRLRAAGHQVDVQLDLSQLLTHIVGAHALIVRSATQAEVERGVALVDALEAKDGVGPGRALELYCLMVLNLNEFAYLD